MRVFYPVESADTGDSVMIQDSLRSLDVIPVCLLDPIKALEDRDFALAPIYLIGPIT